MPSKCKREKNPTDKLRKVLRKKELLRNKKERNAVRDRSLLSQNPKNLITQLEQIDKVMFDSSTQINSNSYNQRMNEDKRKRLLESIDRLIHLKKKDNGKQSEDLIRMKTEYLEWREKFIEHCKSVKAVQLIDVNNIPLPSTEEISDQSTTISSSVPSTIPPSIEQRIIPEKNEIIEVESYFPTSSLVRPKTEQQRNFMKEQQLYYQSIIQTEEDKPLFSSFPFNTLEELIDHYHWPTTVENGVVLKNNPPAPPPTDHISFLSEEEMLRELLIESTKTENELGKKVSLLSSNYIQSDEEDGDEIETKLNDKSGGDRKTFTDEQKLIEDAKHNEMIVANIQTNNRNVKMDSNILQMKYTNNPTAPTKDYSNPVRSQEDPFLFYPQRPQYSSTSNLPISNHKIEPSSKVIEAKPLLKQVKGENQKFVPLRVTLSKQQPKFKATLQSVPPSILAPQMIQKNLSERKNDEEKKNTDDIYKDFLKTINPLLK
ncbi:hypothetical protein SNEBB_008613 [Seison nebaliae]|nr:hypothetical protein SNEBB_008613 [Seison nebaliae]